MSSGRIGITPSAGGLEGVRSYVGVCVLIWLQACPAATVYWPDSSPHREGFVRANGVELQYLDWGGSGEALILIHGMGDNPHVFDDLAPGLTDEYHVIAYARRGHGRSAPCGPFDTFTLAEDLRALMDEMHIRKANLVGWSMGGNEVTGMAASHPERVSRIVYLDGAYDWSDADFVTAYRHMPADLMHPPAEALASLEQYLAYEQNTEFPALAEPDRIKAYILEGIVLGADGRVQARMSAALSDSLRSAVLAEARDYVDVKAPTLAIYAESMFDLHLADRRKRAEAARWEQQYMEPFREKSIARVRAEIPQARIVRISGAHGSFFLTSRDAVIAQMRGFLAKKRSE